MNPVPCIPLPGLHLAGRRPLPGLAASLQAGPSVLAQTHLQPQPPLCGAPLSPAHTLACAVLASEGPRPHPPRLRGLARHQLLRAACVARSDAGPAGGVPPPCMLLEEPASCSLLRALVGSPTRGCARSSPGNPPPLLPSAPVSLSQANTSCPHLLWTPFCGKAHCARAPR